MASADAFKVFERVAVTRAGVFKYRGSEIIEHGLPGEIDWGRGYHLFRPPDEVRASTKSWNALPVFLGHPRDLQPLAVGTTAMDALFDGHDLRVSLIVWDRRALELISSGQRAGLSACYVWQVEMVPGEFEGAPYDGVISGIRGKHVALTEHSRVGTAITMRRLARPQRVAAEARV